jgi:SAM-dependent methyltransferase
MNEPSPNNQPAPVEISDPMDLRFGFGANWADYAAKHFSDERLDIARRHLLGFLKLPDLASRSFLDIGCGSGLHSLAAWRAGARPVTSFDFDPASVATTMKLRQLAGSPPEWTVQQGSVLDRAFVSRLPTADIVYSWGVLHHTGHMWTAIENAASRLHDRSMFYIALYATEAFTSPTPDEWLAVKRAYNRGGPLRRRWMEWQYAWNNSIRHQIAAGRNPLAVLREHSRARGMSYWHDVRDWLGGYPMEFAGNKETEFFCRDRLGLELLHIKAGEANTEFLFRPLGARNYWDEHIVGRPLIDLPGPYEPVGGWAWRAVVDRPAETLGRPTMFMLYEDGSPMGWPNQSLDWISTWGHGRYGLDEHGVLFSATDNSNPNESGKRYQYRADFA